MLSPDQEFYFYQCPKTYVEFTGSSLFTGNIGNTVAYLKLFPKALELLVQRLVVPVITHTMPERVNGDFSKLFSHYFKYNLNQMLQYLFDQFLLPALNKSLDNKINQNQIDLLGIGKQINAKLNGVLNLPLSEIPGNFQKEFREKLGIFVGKVISEYFMPKKIFYKISDREELTNHIKKDFSNEIAPWLQGKCPEINFDKLLEELIRPIFEAKDLHEGVLKIMPLEYRDFFECMESFSKAVDNFIAHPALSLPTAHEMMQNRPLQSSGWAADDKCKNFHQELMTVVENGIFYSFESLPDTLKPFLNKDYQQVLAVIKTLHKNAFSAIRELVIDTGFNVWPSLSLKVVKDNTKNIDALCESLNVQINNKLESIFPNQKNHCPMGFQKGFDRYRNYLSQVVFDSIRQAYEQKLKLACKDMHIEIALLSTKSFFDPLLDDLLNEIVFTENYWEKKKPSKPEEVYEFIAGKPLSSVDQSKIESLLERGVKRWRHSPDRFDFIVEALREFYQKLKLENPFFEFDVEGIVEPLKKDKSLMVGNGFFSGLNDVRRRSNSMFDSPASNTNSSDDTALESASDDTTPEKACVKKELGPRTSSFNSLKNFILRKDSQHGSPPSHFKKN